jgi:20S proteasome alpha/beta subunit
MTLILAIASKDGLVLASDSQATFSTSGQEVKGPTEKLYCPWTNVAWGASGHGGVIQHVEEALRQGLMPATRFEKHDRARVRKALADAVAGAIRPLLTSRMLNLPGVTPPHTGYLFTGYATDGPFLLEVGADLLDQEHLRAGQGYAAIGSGDIFPYFALASLAHFRVGERHLAEAKLVAYRVIEDAISVAARGLGPPVQMVEVKQGQGPGAPARARKLPPDEIKILQDQVLGWKQLESETLDRFVGLQDPSAT